MLQKYHHFSKNTSGGGGWKRVTGRGKKVFIPLGFTQFLAPVNRNKRISEGAVELTEQISTHFCGLQQSLK